MRRLAECAITCVVGIVAVTTAHHVAVARAPADANPLGPVDQVASALVQGIIDDENRVEEIRSLYLRFKGKWTHPPESSAASRTRLEKRNPRAEVTEKRYPELRPEMTEELELAFDERRLRKFSHWHDAQIEVRIWDGKRAVAHTKYLSHEQERYGLDIRPEQFFALSSFFGDLSWLRTAPHRLWWDNQELTDRQRMVRFGSPQDFVVARERQYRGRRCLELKSRRTPGRRLYVGIDDRRLHARVHLGLRDQAEVFAALSKIVGREFKTEQEWAAWDKEHPDERVRTFDRLMDEYGHPTTEHYLDDYREIGGGLWFPAKQGYVSYDRGANDWIVSTRRELELVEAKVNQPLADELFELELRDGVEVNDVGHDPPLYYKQQADRTPEEWQQIVDKHRRQNQEWRKAEAARAALVGKPAPALPESKWLNSDPLTWQSLRGKVVLLHFWAHWCGPCHRDLPDLASRYEKAARRNLIIIGVHSPGSDLGDVEKDMRQNEMGYPILIDVRRAAAQPASWGLLKHQLGINGIPHVVVVDADGKIAAQGQLHQVLRKAYELAEAIE